MNPYAHLRTGAKNAKQANDNAGALGWRLTADEVLVDVFYAAAAAGGVVVEADAVLGIKR